MIAEQRISNGFLNISEYFDGNADTCIISFSSIVQEVEPLVLLLLLTTVDDSCGFIGVVIKVLDLLLSLS